MDLGFLVLLGIAGVILYHVFKKSYQQRKAYEESWREVASRNGLAFELRKTVTDAEAASAKRPAYKIEFSKSPMPAQDATKEKIEQLSEQMTGTYRRHPIKVAVRSTNANDRQLYTYYRDLRQPYTWIVTTVSRSGADSLALRERKLCSVLDRPDYRWRLDVLGKAPEPDAKDHAELGEIQVGDPVFDKRFYVESQPPQFAGRVFGSFLREKIMRAGPPIEIKVEGNEVMFVQKGTLTDANYLQSLLNMSADLADAVEEAW